MSSAPAAASAPARPASRGPPPLKETGAGFSSLSSFNYPSKWDPSSPYQVRRGIWRWVLDTNLIPLLVVIVAVGTVLVSWESINLSHWADPVMMARELREFVARQEHVRDFWVLVGGTVASVAVLTAVVVAYIFTRPRPVYILDFAVYDGPEESRVGHERFVYETRRSGFFTDENVEFQRKLIAVSGLGPATVFPPGIMQISTHGYPDLSMEAARKEAGMVMFDCVEQVLRRTGTKAKDIDIVITNCSLFSPTPSLSAMVVNKFKMRSDIKSLSLGGMGCSAGLISIDLAKDLLQAHPHSTALVISMENITQNWYHGNVRSMIVPNTLFRVGCAAILLSNKWTDRRRAKYQLKTTVRVTKAASDAAYHAVYQTEDSEGNRGVHLVHARELMKVVGDALKTNMTVLGPLVLPWSEKLKFVLNAVKRRLGLEKEPYMPDFKKAFEHFCIHAGGRAVLDGMEQNLKLEPHHIEPSRATLQRYGNTSSSSVWYELAFVERTNRLRRGDRVWQIALGSGFKCNSAVWVCLNPPTEKTCA